MSDPVPQPFLFNRILLSPFLVIEFSCELLHAPIDLYVMSILATAHSDSNQSDWVARPQVLVENPEADALELVVCPHVLVLLLLLALRVEVSQLELEADHQTSKLFSLHPLGELLG